MTDVLITAVFLAAVYSLVALGLSLTWAGLGFLNLAHGVTYSAAAVGAYEASIHIGGNAFVVLIGGIVSGALVGLVIFLVVFLPLDGRRNFDLRTLIATLALALLGENLLLDKFGPQPQTFPEIFSWLPTINIGGTNVTSDQEGAVLAAIVLVAAFVAPGRLADRPRRARADPERGGRSTGGHRPAHGGIRDPGHVRRARRRGCRPARAGLLRVLQQRPAADDQGADSRDAGGPRLRARHGAAAVIVALVESMTATYIGAEVVLVSLFLLIAVVLLVRPRGLAGILETTRA